MTSPASSLRSLFARGSTTKEATLIAAVSLIPALLYLPFVNEPLFGDEAVYSTVALGLLDGQLPYRDLFDNKPPLLYGWFALSFLLFGEEAYAPRLIVAAALSGTAALVHAQARLLFSRGLAFAASGAFAALKAATVLTANATSEILMVLPMTASLVAFTLAIRSGSGRWMLAAGLLSGVALMTKPVALWPGIALGLFALASVWRTHATLPQRLAPALIFAAGAALASLLVLLPVVLSGTFGDFYDATVRFPVQYRDELTNEDRLTRFLMESFVRMPLFAGPLTFAALAGLAVALRRRAWPDDQLLLFWGAGCAFGVASPGFFFPHYFVQLFPAMALLTAVALRSGVVVPRPTRAPAANLAIVLIGGASLASAIGLNGDAYTTTDGDQQHIERGLYGSRVLRENDSAELAAYLNARMAPGDTIYVHGPETAIYFYSGRQPTVRYFYSTPIRVRRDLGVFDEIVAQLEASKPTYIVDGFVVTPADDWNLSYVANGTINLHPPDFVALLERDYEFVDHVFFANVYRLKR